MFQTDTERKSSQLMTFCNLSSVTYPHIRPPLSSPSLSSPSMSSPPLSSPSISSSTLSTSAMSTPAKSSVNVQSCNVSPAISAFSLLQSSCRLHCPPRPHAAASRYARRQHIRWAVRSRRVYHRRQNGLQLNWEKSEALIVGRNVLSNQLRAVTSSVSSVPSVSVAAVDLPVTDDMKVLGVVLDRRLTFQKHVSSGTIVQLSYTGYPTHSAAADYGTRTDAGLWSDPVKDRLLQRCAPRRSKLRTASRSCNGCKQCGSDRSPRTQTIPRHAVTHWLPVQQRIDYKVAVLTFKPPRSSSRRRRCTFDA